MARRFLPDRFANLWPTLDTDKVPAPLGLIRERFPEARPASSVTIDLLVDGVRAREQWVRTDGVGRSPSEVNAYNGWVSNT